jgi:hypothetical protein
LKANNPADFIEKFRTARFIAFYVRDIWCIKLGRQKSCPRLIPLRSSGEAMPWQ